jgi:hypothetical protein|nr:hypothetical protein 12 [Desulfobacterales bacterium]
MYILSYGDINKCNAAEMQILDGIVQWCRESRTLMQSAWQSMDSNEQLNDICRQLGSVCQQHKSLCKRRKSIGALHHSLKFHVPLKRALAIAADHKAKNHNRHRMDNILRFVAGHALGIELVVDDGQRPMTINRFLDPSATMMALARKWAQAHPNWFAAIPESFESHGICCAKEMLFKVRHAYLIEQKSSLRERIKREMTLSGEELSLLHRFL